MMKNMPRMLSAASQQLLRGKKLLKLTQEFSIIQQQWH